MDCITEAKKFVQRAQEASHREVVNQHLAMADWYLNEALKERDETERNGRQKKTESKKSA
ncbi:MAG TPA: hypothetical protein VFO09_04420 [Methyloceanibacter sp.]|jgi:hypothetical protein|nr:hypothetical protein [Methyloceanibacter sp.]